MTEVQKQFIDLIKKNVFCGEKSSYKPAQDVISLAAKHDLMHLLGSIGAGEYFAAIRSLKFEYALDKMKDALKKSAIPFIPMKGAVIRYLYPQPWMRLSSDIDVLIKKKDLNAALKSLTEAGAVIDSEVGGHDVKVNISGVTVEVHFRLDYLKDALLDQAWNYAEVFDGSEHRFTDAFFYYSFIAHTAVHFLTGGAGVRPILDLQFVNRDHSLLSGTGLESFSVACENLSDRWFKERDVDVNDCFEQMILEGNLYFDRKQWTELRTVMSCQNSNILRRVFIPYEELKDRYPFLNNHRTLLPFYELKRIVDMLKHGRIREHLTELEYMNLSNKRIEDIEVMLEELGFD